MRAPSKRLALLVAALIAIVPCVVVSRELVRIERKPHTAPVAADGDSAALVETPSRALPIPTIEGATAPPAPEESALALAGVDAAEPEMAPAFPPAPLSIRGAVLDPAGEYVPWCSVQLSEASWDSVQSSSGPQGTFEFTRLSAGDYKLEASPMSPDEQSFLADSLSVDVRAGEQDVVLRLRPAGVIRGRVTDAASSAPARCNMRLFAQADIREVGSLQRGVCTGEFRFVQLLAGRYCLVAWDGERVALESDIEVVAERESEVTLSLEPGATAIFTLADGVDADVVVRAWTGSRSLGVDWVTRDEPLEVHAPLGELRYVVELRYPTWLTGDEQRIELAGGERHRIEITGPKRSR